MHLISIIVPIYKVETYLSECVESIINQTYNNLEIILVDDGSPDNCPSLCDEYAAKDSRIKVIHKNNGGLSSARNAGIDIASGEYICFVDSDDILHPQYCEILLKCILDSDADFCACKVNRFTDTIDITPIYQNEFFHHTSTFSEFFKMQISNKFEMGVWNRIYKKSIFEHLRFMNGKIHEDIIFAADLFKYIKNHIAFCEIPLYFYRQREDSIISKQQHNNVCSVDRVFAGSYLLDNLTSNNKDLFDVALVYAVSYPWSFIDGIYVNKAFNKNKDFIISLQQLLQKHKDVIKHNATFNKHTKHRMLLFARSRWLFGINVFARLIRLYFFKLLKKDPYKGGHGI